MFRLPFQFCLVAIIKEARALSNKIITVCSAANANGSATFVPTAGSIDTHKPYTPRDRRSVLVPLTLGQKLISSSTFVHHVDFRDDHEGAFSSDCFVSEVFDHDILGTRLEQFHDSARLPI